MKKAELKFEAGRRSVSAKGSKKAIIERLKPFIVESEEIVIDEDTITEAIDEAWRKMRNCVARKNGHGVSGKRGYYKVSSSSLDPLHGYAIIYKAYLYAIFLFSKRLTKTKCNDGSLGKYSVVFLERIARKSSEYKASAEWLKEEAPKITAKFINADTGGSTKHEPRLSGKAAQWAAASPDVYLKTLLESIAIVEYNDASRYDDAHQSFTSEEKYMYAYLLVYGNLLADQFRCMTVRINPPQIPKPGSQGSQKLYRDAKRQQKIKLQQNCVRLERLGYLLSVIENIFLPGITCHYTVELNCLAHEYAKKFMEKYSCSPGSLGSCQTMERLNSYWKNICAFRRKRGVDRFLKDGTKKTLLSTHQQRMAKFYYISIYGDRIKPQIPKLPKEEHKISNDLCQFLLRLGENKINTSGLSCVEEIRKLETLCSKTLGLYLGEEDIDISKEEAKRQFDILLEYSLYERGVILQSDNWNTEDADDEEN